jgi:hypothetical protein
MPGMTLELSNEEHALLLELLRDELGRLKGEIYRTEAADFKEELKAREALLASIIGRLEALSA